MKSASDANNIVRYTMPPDRLLVAPLLLALLCGQPALRAHGAETSAAFTQRRASEGTRRRSLAEATPTPERNLCTQVEYFCGATDVLTNVAYRAALREDCEEDEGVCSRAMGGSIACV